MQQREPAKQSLPSISWRRRQRRQNNKTNYIRQNWAHVNMWNKAAIRAVVLSRETPIAPFPRRLQNVANFSRINVDLFI